MKLFLKEADFEAFERVIEQTLETRSMRILAYCLMSNHWHLVLWPEHDGDLGAFMQKLTITHARNWQINRARVGYGTSIRAATSRSPSRATSTFIM